MLEILSSILGAMQNLGAAISNIFKCRSQCCNKIIINNNRFSKCNSFGDIYNKWNKQPTPAVESPRKKH
jgi:hypothetical protein